MGRLIKEILPRNVSKPTSLCYFFKRWQPGPIFGPLSQLCLGVSFSGLAFHVAKSCRDYDNVREGYWFKNGASNRTRLTGKLVWWLFSGARLFFILLETIENKTGNLPLETKVVQYFSCEGFLSMIVYGVKDLERFVARRKFPRGQTIQLTGFCQPGS